MSEVYNTIEEEKGVRKKENKRKQLKAPEIRRVRGTGKDGIKNLKRRGSKGRRGKMKYREKSKGIKIERLLEVSDYFTNSY